MHHDVIKQFNNRIYLHKPTSRGQRLAELSCEAAICCPDSEEAFAGTIPAGNSLFSLFPHHGRASRSSVSF